MAEYIERQEVYSKINELPLTEDAAMEILWAIDDIPTADVSACCNCYYLDEPNAKYCPNCRAKMDGEPNDP